MHSDSESKYSDHHENGFRRVEPGDPEQCQAVTGHGQCTFGRVPGGDYCATHGGNKVIENQEREKMRNYRLTKFQSRFANAASQPQIKSLRDEIGILRVLVEERINQCNDPVDLMMQSNTISDLVLKIKTTVEACHKLEEKLGVMMDKEQAIQFAMEVSEVIARYVTDDDQLQAISTDLQTLIASKIT